MGLFSSVGDFLGGGNSQSLGRTADEFLVNVSTPGATSKFNEDTNTVTSTLDPQHKEFQNLLFNIGQGLLGQFQDKDFGQVAQDQFDLLTDIGARERGLQRQSLENRLFNQGLLGSTAGLNQLTSFNQATADQDLQREIAARNFANQQRAQLFNQGLQSLGGISTLDSIGLAPIGLMGLGAGRANLLAQQSMRSSDIGAGLFNSLLGAGKSATSGGLGGGGLFG